MRLLLLLTFLHLSSGDESLLRTVSTNWGDVVGELVSPDANDLPPVTQYLGIPYGVPPVAAARFTMVNSAPKWTHSVKEARTLSASCIQSLPELAETKALRQTSAQRFDFLHRMLPRLKVQSEDCLYMNIFVPERLQSMAKLSVVVLVHGGEYDWGSGGPFNGTTLAAYGQIIVVTLNYRLGPLGFLGRCEQQSCRGNEGLSDVFSAVTMLRSIIEKFGGSNDSITMLGIGSGASLVSLMMASPVSQPSGRSFRRAILLDGTALAPGAISEDPQAAFLDLAIKLNCATNASAKVGASMSKDMVTEIVNCLGDHSSENITKAAATVRPPSFLSAFAPIVDGVFVPTDPSVAFSPPNSALFRDLDLMVGTASSPAHHLLGNDDLNLGVDEGKRTRMIRTLVRNLFKFHRKEILAAIENEYEDWSDPRETDRARRDSLLALLGDALFVAPLVRTLRAHAADRGIQNEKKTFFFHFAHQTRKWASEQPASGIQGSFSGDHLPYILGYPLATKETEERLYHGFDGDDRAMARVMMTYVSNFAKSGDPQLPVRMSKQSATEESFSRVAWPPYSRENREAYLEIGRRDSPAVVRHHYRNAQVGFWLKLVPQLQQSGREAVEKKWSNEEHHLLDDYLKADTFYGRVRPFGGYANFPFPPPPTMPPPPPLSTKSPATSSTSPGDSSASSSSVTAAHPYSSILPLTVAIGCGLLVLNICIFFGMYRKCPPNSRDTKKLQLQYHTYSAAHAPHAPSDVQYSIHSPEPLLSASQKTSIAGIRAGVSPTCPRHGRSAMSAAAASRGNSLGSGVGVGGGGGGGSMGRSDHLIGSLPPSHVPIEEIQV